jgi:aminomethyltransferase
MMNEYEAGYNAIRNSVAIIEEDHMHCVKLSGNNALELLKNIFPFDVFLQDGQMKHSLLLEEDGSPFADVYLCRELQDYYILGYGPTGAEVINWIKSKSSDLKDCSLTDLSESCSFISLDGPYAWELVASVLGNDVIGLPYLGMAVWNQIIIFRAGMTGEFGYHILIKKENKSELIKDFNQKGIDFNLFWANQESRSQCWLENFFFDISREGKLKLTPMELQLQWRLSRSKKHYPGSLSIENIRKRGWKRRMVCFITKDALQQEDQITINGEVVGFVICLGFSPSLNEFVGKAMIDEPFWHASLDGFKVGDKSLRTVSPPVISNKSLKINIHRDSFRFIKN